MITTTNRSITGPLIFTSIHEYLPFVRKRRMRVVVCGDRFQGLYEEDIRREISSLPSDAIIIHGGCQGVDTLAGKIAIELGYIVEVYSANWSKYGKAAGPIRNKQMVDSGVDLGCSTWPSTSKRRCRRSRKESNN